MRRGPACRPARPPQRGDYRRGGCKGALRRRSGVDPGLVGARRRQRRRLPGPSGMGETVSFCRPRPLRAPRGDPGQGDGLGPRGDVCCAIWRCPRQHARGRAATRRCCSASSQHFVSSGPSSSVSTSSPGEDPAPDSRTCAGTYTTTRSSGAWPHSAGRAERPRCIPVFAVIGTGLSRHGRRWLRSPCC